jgi:hypothetical protein
LQSNSETVVSICASYRFKRRRSLSGTDARSKSLNVETT